MPRIDQAHRLVNRGKSVVKFMEDELRIIVFGHDERTQKLLEVGRRRQTSNVERAKRRAAGKRQRKARQIQQRKARSRS